MKSGVYRHKKRKELLYLFVGVAQDHDTHNEIVVYVPLFIRNGWENTPIMTYRSLDDFNENFEWISEKQPDTEKESQ